ncbi:Y+L amino acid transporter 2 [Orchesella cincta]|uniref:Y+L amino acid transporter 2 n=1 Tax=Orchesella cincta TaxID=48709 RepID=A0A1D2N3T2_ORCCI|nr:Y+L amino acid transporter 2 [Orchesella cincta]
MPSAKDAKYAEVPANPPPAGDKPEEEKVGLQAKLSLLNGITVIVGSIIGSGIFVSPTGVLKNTGSPNLALVVWTASGVFSLIGAYCYAELGCMITKTGADYAYIMVTFGPFLAFIRLWVECMIVRPCSQAIVALTFATYILKPFFEDCDPPADSVRLLAAVVICFLTFVNCWNVTWATIVQDVFTYAKLVALAIIIATGFYQLYQGHTEYFTFEGSEQNLNFIIEELKDPVKNLPIAIGFSCVLVTIVYFLTNVAFFTTLSPAEMLNSEAVAVTFANRLYGYMAWIVPVFVAASTFGGVNGILLTSSRLFYAGAMEGQMPEVLTMIQTDKHTPVPAVLFVALLSLVYLAFPNIGDLINYVGFATWLSIGVAVLCIPILRWKQPDLPRPIKVNMFYPIIYIIGTVIITVVPMFADPYTTGTGLLVILTAVPVYFLFIAWKNKPKCVRDIVAYAKSPAVPNEATRLRSAITGNFLTITPMQHYQRVPGPSSAAHDKNAFELALTPSLPTQKSTNYLRLSTSDSSSCTRLIQRILVVLAPEQPQKV